MTTFTLTLSRTCVRLSLPFFAFFRFNSTRHTLTRFVHTHARISYLVHIRTSCICSQHLLYLHPFIYIPFYLHTSCILLPASMTYASRFDIRRIPAWKVSDLIGVKVDLDPVPHHVIY